MSRLKRFLTWMLDGHREWSYRSEAGVRILVSETPTSMRVQADLTDPQTKEILRRQLEKYAQFDIVDGRLVKKET